MLIQENMIRVKSKKINHIMKKYSTVYGIHMISISQFINTFYNLNIYSLEENGTVQCVIAKEN